jgi:hypothetical protein
MLDGLVSYCEQHILSTGGRIVNKLKLCPANLYFQTILEIKFLKHETC